jgi:adenylate kinase
MVLVIVAGVPAVGKTTVLKEIEEDVKDRFQILNVGEEMSRIAREMGLERGRDELKDLPLGIQEEIRKKAVRKALEALKRGSLLLETYCSVRTEKGYLPGLPRDLLMDLRPRQIVLLEADPDEILVRRVKDTSRKRKLEYVALIDQHQRMGRVFAMTYATLTGAPVKMIQNHDGKLERAASELMAILEGIHV